MALDLSSATSSISSAVNNMAGSSQAYSAGSGSASSGGSSPVIAYQSSGAGTTQPFTLDVVTNSIGSLGGTTQFVFSNKTPGGLY